MNLCPPVDLYEEDDNKIDRNKQYIIEFGDEWTLGEKMEYKIKVKPGQSINDKTILFLHVVKIHYIKNQLIITTHYFCCRLL